MLLTRKNEEDTSRIYIYTRVSLDPSYIYRLLILYICVCVAYTLYNKIYGGRERNNHRFLPVCHFPFNKRDEKKKKKKREKQKEKLPGQPVRSGPSQMADREEVIKPDGQCRTHHYYTKKKNIIRLAAKWRANVFQSDTLGSL